ncbi:MAG: hypothetical protein N3F03_04740, partial [Ignavibacteria bacterium]|nr:hypothetical protein [Ignavibacteria bacterium]
LKNSSGALMDLQFLLQYKILINSFNEKFIGKNFKATIEQLSKSDKILSQHLKKLKSNYETLFKSILIYQLITGKKSIVLTKNFNSKYFERNLKIAKSKNLFEYLSQTLEENSKILKQISPEIFG